jgi:uncharacterized membrane protein YjjP (DUF1212 family)
MAELKIIELFHSHYGKLVFFLSLILSFFIIPRKIFFGWYIILGIIFMITFSLTLTCFVKTIKERIIHVKRKKGSVISLISSIVGVLAIHTCSIGMPICASTFGIGFISIILPKTFLIILDQFAIYVVCLSIFVQFFALYYMGCFVRK